MATIEIFMNLRFQTRIWGYGAAMIGIFAVTVVLVPWRLQISLTTVALSLLLIVLFIAAFWGSRPAILASVAGMLCFNYFFLPPVGTWTITDRENLVALAAFLVVALVAGQLSARLKKRAEESETKRVEIERLYAELNEAFERASQAEALKQSEKLKSALLDAVTHDIRTPLTSIKASVTILLDETEGATFDGETRIALNAEMRSEMLKVIDEETDRLNHFVEGMIELAQIEAGEMNFRRKWDAVEDIIEAALMRAEPRVRGRRINVELEKNLPVIRVDSRAVTEVLYTLIDNAGKYSPTAAPIYIKAFRSDESNITFSVRDEGEGIAPELHERIFDKFFRATRDGDFGVSPSGSGLGLAIAKGIVEAHDGKIRVGDTNEKGATFEFSLPIGDVEEKAENKIESDYTDGKSAE